MIVLVGALAERWTRDRKVAGWQFPAYDAACELTRWQHFSARNDVMGTHGRHLESAQEQSCQISFRSDLKRRHNGALCLVSTIPLPFCRCRFHLPLRRNCRSVAIGSNPILAVLP